MAAEGRTARGLRRIPQYVPPEDERNQPRPSREERQKRKQIKRSLFSLGRGLDMPLFVFIMVLLAIGLVMLFSASYASGYYYDGSSYYYIKRQGGFAIAGVVAMLLISTFDYHRFHRLAYFIYIFSIVLLALILVFKALGLRKLAPPQYDAYRWLQFGPIRFQPSEVAKFAVILLCAHYISQHFREMGDIRHGVLPCVLFLGLPVLLIYPENHLSAMLIVAALGAILMFVGGTKYRYLTILGILAGVVLYLKLSGGDSYQAGRVDGWLDPFNPETMANETYQIVQSLYAIGSGGLLGVGLGQSRQKYLYLPEPQNDFIFAIVCEELGFVGALVVIILFSLLIWRGMYVALHAQDRFGTLLGLGIIFQVGLQAVLNICVVTNTIPNTGISLPFFSYGGTSLLMLLGEMGVLLNISRSASVEKT